MKTKDLYWCNEGCGFVKKDHRCEQWCLVTKIPGEAIDALTEKYEREDRQRTSELLNKIKNGEI